MGWGFTKTNNDIENLYNSFKSELEFVKSEILRADARNQTMKKIDISTLSRYYVKVSIYGSPHPIGVYFSDTIKFETIQMYPLLMGINDNRALNVYPISNKTWSINKCNLDNIVKDIRNNNGLVVGSRSTYFAFLVDDDDIRNEPDYYANSYFDCIGGLGKYTTITNITNVELVSVDSHKDCLRDSKYSHAIINYVKDCIRVEVKSVDVQKRDIVDKMIERYGFIFYCNEFSSYRNNIHEFSPSLITKEKFIECYIKTNGK